MYDKGMVLGRFQGIHKGHQALIEKALENCRRVLVFVGSSDKSGTVRDPFTYEFRERMLRDLYGEKVTISPLPDIGVGDVGFWGEYLLRMSAEVLGEQADAIVCGNEEKYKLWFPDKPSLALIHLDRNDIPMCATQLREYILNDDYRSFCECTDERLRHYYGVMRGILLKVSAGHGCADSCMNKIK